MIESYAISESGGRPENQDRVLADHSLGLFAVADGMGGHRAGALAAELALATLRYYVDSSRDRFDVSWPFGYSFDLSLDANRVSTGIRLANRHVWRQAGTAPEHAGMGTTIATLLLTDAGVVIGNVGDSRVYLFRDEDLRQLTEDDTVAASPLAELGGENAYAQFRHVLTRAVGSRETVEAHILEHGLNQQDRFLLVSDGLYGVLEEPAIRSILAGGTDIQKTAERLLEAALCRHAPDNVSLVLLGYD